MRGLSSLICAVLAIAGILALNTNVLSRDYPRSAIRFDLGVWDIPDSEIGITVHHTDLEYGRRSTDVRVSGLSASLAFSHLVGQRFAWELSLGGFSDSESSTLSKEIDERYNDDYYETISSNAHSVSVAYIMVGLIYYPLYELDRVESKALSGLSSFVRPYLTAGIGPYFGWDVRWDEDTITDADFATAMGAYPGVGIDLLLSKHFIFNVDLRYHFVEFGEPLKAATDYSGLNAVAGFKIAF